jgi:ABC-type transport system involved in cytochrome bd biosynthesis fused ATPase/permease subunit
MLTIVKYFLRYNDNPAFDVGPDDVNMAQIKRNSISSSPADMIVNDTKTGHVNKAVVVKNAMKTYAGAVRPVLNNFNMTVEEGTM